MALSAGALAQAPALTVDASPHTPRGFEAVIAEVHAMVKTDESLVTQFVVREATPERVEQLLNSPVGVKLSRVMRENALIFLGLGRTLRFEKPSDVLTKISGWFPAEFATVRSKTDLGFGFHGQVNLFGPYENWTNESIAFITLWNCSPVNAWVFPNKHPFGKNLTRNARIWPIKSQSSSELEADFGHCVMHRSGYYTQRSTGNAAGDAVLLKEIKDRATRMGERAKPVLAAHFAAALQALDCRGTGPDDCVLMLRNWASLTPTDPLLARSLQRLEPQVDPDGPLPAAANALASWSDAKFEDAQVRFDEGLRRAAYLRAKLASVLNAPEHWPPDALPRTFRQMSQLRRDFAVPYVLRWSFYELAYANAPLDPWVVAGLSVAQGPAGPAMAAELRRLAMENPPNCDVLEPWLGAGGPALQTEHALWRMRQGGTRAKEPGCATPDYTWLSAQADTPHRHLLFGLLAYMAHLGVAEQAPPLDGLTQAGAACKARAAAPAWLAQVCATRQQHMRSKKARSTGS